MGLHVHVSLFVPTELSGPVHPAEAQEQDKEENLSQISSTQWGILSTHKHLKNMDHVDDELY